MSDTDTKNDVALAGRSLMPHERDKPEPSELVRQDNWCVPASFAEAEQMAEKIANSNLVPPQYRNKPDDAFVALMYAASLRINAFLALSHIAVINGKPSLWGAGLQAVILAHPECDDVIHEFDDQTMTATCTIKRRGRTPVVQTFSKEDAEMAGLWGKVSRDGKPSTWKLYAKRMLKWRAFGFAATDAFADALAGIIPAEEAIDYPTERIVEARVSTTDAVADRLAAKLAVVGGEKPRDPSVPSESDVPSPAVETEEPEPQAEPSGDDPAEDDPKELANARRRFSKLLKDIGMERDEALEFARERLGPEIQSSQDLTVLDFSLLTDALTQGRE